MDIIEQLLQRDLTDICFQIFSQLDSETFGNCQLVCQLWKQFIEHYFYYLPKGQKWLKQKLVSNFLSETYQPKEDKVISKRCIADIKADQKNIFVSSFASNDLVGKIYANVSNYELQSLNLIWTLTLWSANEEDNFEKTFLLLCINDENIFVVTGAYHIYIINRLHGEITQKINNVHGDSIIGRVSSM